MGTGFSRQKKEAKLMQQKLADMQQQMATLEVTGTAGNGLVSIILSGEGKMKAIKIKPECVDPEDIEGLEILIKAAYEDAQKKVEKNSTPSLPGFPAGMFG